LFTDCDSEQWDGDDQDSEVEYDYKESNAPCMPSFEDYSSNDANHLVKVAHWLFICSSSQILPS
jgi:hypothetical protein